MSAQKFYFDGRNSRTTPNGAIVHCTPLPFSLTIAVIENCMCPDGKRHKVYITGMPDTVFSQPACVQIYVKATKKTKTVSGYVTFEDNEPEFRSVRSGKNYNILPNNHSPLCEQSGCYTGAVLSIWPRRLPESTFCQGCALDQYDDTMRARLTKQRQKELDRLFPERVTAL